MMKAILDEAESLNRHGDTLQELKDIADETGDTTITFVCAIIPFSISSILVLRLACFLSSASCCCSSVKVLPSDLY